MGLRSAAWANKDRSSPNSSFSALAAGQALLKLAPFYDTAQSNIIVGIQNSRNRGWLRLTLMCDPNLGANLPNVL